MAASSYSTDLTTILIEFPNTTGWTALGSGASGLNAPETDYFIQGNNCITKNAWASALKGMIYNFGSGITVPTDGAVIMFLAHATMNSVATKASGGIQLLIGSSASAFKQWYVAGSDTVVFGLWRAYPVNPGVTADATTGSPSATLQFFGGQANLPSGGPTKGSPFAIDAMRYGRCRIDAIDGDAGNGYATLALAEATANSNTNRWGLLELVDGIFFFQGFLSMGTSGTAVDWRDSNRALNIRATDKVTSAFNRFEVMNASSNVEWTNYRVRALGTVSRGTFVVTAGTFTAIDCQFTDMGTFTFLASSTVTGCTFRGCGQITAPGTNMTGSKVLAYTGAADTSALVWNVNENPDGELNDMQFTRGANAHHGIRFGASTPISVTLRGVENSGFNAANEQNDSFLYFDDKGSDTDWTVNVVGGSGNFSYKRARAGDTVTIVSNPVTLTITAQDSTSGSPIQGAEVLVLAGTGFLGGASISISRSGATATVTHTSHGFSTGNAVRIRGAAENEYNGIYTITVTGVDNYTYTVSGTPATPATGAPVSALVIIDALTDSNGEASDTRSWTSDQAFIGRVRKGTSTPVYKAQPVSGIIDSSSGASVTAPMISDA